MKDSGIEWIGEIPVHWSCIKQKRALCLINGRAFSESEFKSDGKYKILRVGNLFSNQTWFYSNLELDEDKYCSMGDLLYSWSMSYGPTIWNGEKIIYHYHIWKVKHGVQDDKKYIYYYLIALSNALLAEVHETTMGFITMRIMNNSYYPQPPYEEQQKISSHLDKKTSAIDSTIVKERTLIEKLKEYRQAVITEAVTKGLDKNAKMKDSGVEWIGEIPEGWGTICLKWILKKPLQYGAIESGDPYEAGLPRYIRITDIAPNGELLDTNKLSLPWEKATEYLLEDGDILFARSGASVGKSFLYLPRYGCAAFAGYLIRASVQSKRMHPLFLYYYTLSSSYDIWKKNIFIQATIPNIGADKYSNLKISIPTLSEQKEIADFLDKKCAAIDKAISDREAVIEKLEEYKKSLIYEYVTGKKEAVCG